MIDPRSQDRTGFEKAQDGSPELDDDPYRDLSNLLGVIVEGVSDGVTAQDANGRLVFANAAAARACGFSSVHELMTTPAEQIAERFEMLDEHGNPFQPDRLPAHRVLRGERSATAEIRVRERKTGREWWSRVRATAVPASDGTPKLAINVWYDVTAERRREQHERYLAQSSAALGSSLDYEATLTTLAGLLVPGFADWCAIHLLSGEELRNVVVAHVDPAKVEMAREFQRKYPPEPRTHGVWRVVRTGQSELYPEVTDEVLAQNARSPEHLEGLRSMGFRSVLIAPIRIRERVLGTMALVISGMARQYDQHDVALAEELGYRIGNAIENAKLYAAEHRARERLALLARAGEAFSSSLVYEQILHSVVQIALPELGDLAFFDIIEGAQVRRVAAAHDDPQTERLIRETHWVKSESGATNLCALSTGEPCFHPQIDDQWLQKVANGSEPVAVLRKIRVCSMLSVPLRANGKVVGALTFCHGKSGRHHTKDDLELAQELARRAGIAVAQARLFVAAQDAARIAESAAKSAEEASQVKDDFLATVSHELRTPLTAILGWATLLRERKDEASRAKGIEVIHRNALAQSKIIEDILDMSRIVTGKLRLEPRPADVMSIVRDAIEVIRPSATAKRISVELTSKGSCRLVVDPERLQQAIWNLLSNAVKFTGLGGQIKIAVQQERAQMTIAVSDTGKGIEPKFLPFVFDRFKQGDSSTTRRVGGLGLGLAIVRHIVELHGGRVLAQSAGVGLGATFTLVLPVRRIESPALVETPGKTERQLTAEQRMALLSGLRILVVDDEADTRDLMHTVLAGAGATVQTVASAEAGLDALRRFHPHVLLSDIGMPGQDGISFMKRVRTLSDDEGGSVPSIALTAYAREEDRLRSIAAGFNTHLGKPVDIEYLIGTVASIAGVISSASKAGGT